jgi:hypothetical protein
MENAVQLVPQQRAVPRKEAGTMTDNGNEPGGTRGRPFAPGQSGNPAGRPRGSRNRATLAAQIWLDESVGEIASKAREMALSGDRSMITLLLTPVLRQERPITFELPELRTAADVENLMTMLLEQVAGGEITLDDAGRVRALAETRLKTLEAYDFERRLQILEQCLFPERD